ncbi:3'-5' exonuclease [Schwartzia sp. (in: firmicutes)]
MENKDALEQVNEKQRQAIDTLNRNVLLLASAGTGKTGTLARRIAKILEEKLAEPEEILCLTFTNKACQEMKERIVKYVGSPGHKVVVRTIHSFCFDVIRQEAKRKTDFFTDFMIFDEEDCAELISQINSKRFPVGTLQRFINTVKEKRTEYGVFSDDIGADYRKTVRRLFDELGDEGVYNFFMDSKFKFRAEMAAEMEAHGAEYVLLYNRLMHDEHGLDFNDLILSTYDLFRQEEVCLRWREKFRFINIDEVQDTNELEYDILSKLFGDNHILLSGDYYQTIYEWRGSRPSRIFERFEKEYSPVRIILEENYRATRTLVQASYACLDSFFGGRASEWEGKIRAASDEKGDPVMLRACRSVEEEAEWIYRCIENLPCDDPSKVCILTRSNAYNKQLWQYLQHVTPLVRRVDFFLADEMKLFRRQEVKDALAFVKLTLNKYDAASMKRILKRFVTGVGQKTIDEIESDAMRESGLRLTDFLDESILREGDSYAQLIREYEAGNVVVFDVESTGVDTTDDEIIQIAGVRLGADGSITGKFNRLLKNTKPVGMSETVHHISDEKLAKEGGDPGEVLTEFLEFIRGSLIVGHNVSFDLSILLSETERLELPRPDFVGWYDTLDIYRRFYPNLTNHKLESLGAYIKVSHPSSHDAFDDICATAELLVYAVRENIRPTQDTRRQCIAKYGHFFEQIAGSVTELHREVVRRRPVDFLEYIIKNHLIPYYEKEERRMEHLRELYRAVRAYDTGEYSAHDTLVRFIRTAALSANPLDAGTQRQPRVPIITVHQAKGTEFDYVFLAGLHENGFPSYRAVKDGNRAEEQRLFYTAITRARKQLFLSWCQYGKNYNEQMESTFIASIPKKYIAYCS